MNKTILLFTFLILTKTVFATVTKEEFESVKSALHQAYSEISISTNDILKINLAIPGLAPSYWWDIDMVHASYVRFDDVEHTEHRIYLMGGFARLEGMTPDGLALTGCHEIAHGIGGPPFKDTGTTAEGQADYFATRVCLPIVFKYLRELRPISKSETFEDHCREQDLHDNLICLRLMTAIESDLSFFHSQGHDVSFGTHSNHIQRELNTSASYYPDAQCRIDTMVNGVLGHRRPICWFPRPFNTDKTLY